MGDAFDEKIKALDSKLRKSGDFVGKVHHEDEVYHDTKGKIFHDADCDYNYSEERMNEETAAFSEQTRSKAEFTPQKTKKRFKNPALVQGLIMSEILQKPRSLRSYKEDEEGLF